MALAAGAHTGLPCTCFEERVRAALEGRRVDFVLATLKKHGVECEHALRYVHERDLVSIGFNEGTRTCLRQYQPSNCTYPGMCFQSATLAAVQTSTGAGAFAGAGGTAVPTAVEAGLQPAGEDEDMAVDRRDLQAFLVQRCVPPATAADYAQALVSEGFRTKNMLLKFRTEAELGASLRQKGFKLAHRNRLLVWYREECLSRGGELELAAGAMQVYDGDDALIDMAMRSAPSPTPWEVDLMSGYAQPTPDGAEAPAPLAASQLEAGPRDSASLAVSEGATSMVKFWLHGFAECSVEEPLGTIKCTPATTIAQALRLVVATKLPRVDSTCVVVDGAGAVMAPATYRSTAISDLLLSPGGLALRAYVSNVKRHTPIACPITQILALRDNHDQHGMGVIPYTNRHGVGRPLQPGARHSDSENHGAHCTFAQGTQGIQGRDFGTSGTPSWIRLSETHGQRLLVKKGSGIPDRPGLWCAYHVFGWMTQQRLWARRRTGAAGPSWVSVGYRLERCPCSQIDTCQADTLAECALRLLDFYGNDFFYCKPEPLCSPTNPQLPPILTLAAVLPRRPPEGQLRALQDRMTPPPSVPRLRTSLPAARAGGGHAALVPAQAHGQGQVAGAVYVQDATPPEVLAVRTASNSVQIAESYRDVRLPADMATAFIAARASAASVAAVRIHDKDGHEAVTKQTTVLYATSQQHAGQVWVRLPLWAPVPGSHLEHTFHCYIRRCDAHHEADTLAAHFKLLLVKPAHLHVRDLKISVSAGCGNLAGTMKDATDAAKRRRAPDSSSPDSTSSGGGSSCSGSTGSAKRPRHASLSTDHAALRSSTFKSTHSKPRVAAAATSAAGSGTCPSALRMPTTPPRLLSPDDRARPLSEGACMSLLQRLVELNDLAVRVAREAPDLALPMPLWDTCRTTEGYTVTHVAALLDYDKVLSVLIHMLHADTSKETQPDEDIECDGLLPTGTPLQVATAAGSAKCIALLTGGHDESKSRGPPASDVVHHHDRASDDTRATPGGTCGACGDAPDDSLSDALDGDLGDTLRDVDMGAPGSSVSSDTGSGEDRVERGTPPAIPPVPVCALSPQAHPRPRDVWKRLDPTVSIAGSSTPRDSPSTDVVSAVPPMPPMPRPSDVWAQLCPPPADNRVSAGGHRLIAAGPTNPGAGGSGALPLVTPLWRLLGDGDDTSEPDRCDGQVSMAAHERFVASGSPALRVPESMRRIAHVGDGEHITRRLERMHVGATRTSTLRTSQVRRTIDEEETKRHRGASHKRAGTNRPPVVPVGAECKPTKRQRSRPPQMGSTHAAAAVRREVEEYKTQVKHEPGEHKSARASDTLQPALATTRDETHAWAAHGHASNLKTELHSHHAAAFMPVSKQQQKVKVQVQDGASFRAPGSLIRKRGQHASQKRWVLEDCES